MRLSKRVAATKIRRCNILIVIVNCSLMIIDGHVMRLLCHVAGVLVQSPRIPYRDIVGFLSHPGRRSVVLPCQICVVYIYLVMGISVLTRFGVTAPLLRLISAFAISDIVSDAFLNNKQSHSCQCGHHDSNKHPNKRKQSYPPCVPSSHIRCAPYCRPSRNPLRSYAVHSRQQSLNTALLSSSGTPLR